MFGEELALDRIGGLGDPEVDQNAREPVNHGDHERGNPIHPTEQQSEVERECERQKERHGVHLNFMIHSNALMSRKMRHFSYSV